jgi:formate dehydrogenase maturation protein FdhE
MSKSYIYNEDGELEEAQDHSVEGYEFKHCPRCGKTVVHYLIAISTTRGYIWMCSVCLYEHP